MSASTAQHTIHSCASRSSHLCEGLLAALQAIHQPGLARIVEIIQADANAAAIACRMEQGRRTARLDRRTIRDLKGMVSLGGRAAIPLALQIAARLAAR